MAIVEDEEGTAVLLQLYNQPEETQVRAQDILQPQNVCIIKEPFFKVATDGSYSLRVDHVSDIFWLSDDDQRIPSKWKKQRSTEGQSSHEIRMEGNDAVQKKDWGKAERLYTAAICTATTQEERQLSYLNRSLANLRLDRPEKALEDASNSSQSRESSEKILFRKARALYELGRFQSCLATFQELLSSHPNNVDAQLEIERTKQRIRQSDTGDYDFKNMHRQAKSTPPIVDCATYIGQIAVRASPGRGRGLFATQFIEAGKLLLCEKAFAYSYAGDGNSDKHPNMRILMNVSTKRVTVGGQAHLISQIVQKLYHNHNLAQQFADLYHGDYSPVASSEVDGHPVVDSFLIERVVSLNCFGSPRTSLDHFQRRSSGNMDRKEPGHTTCGVWIQASHLNHSCLSNCRRSFIGDMQIIRASRDIEPGTELLFQYQSPDAHSSYEETQQKFSNWGFTCDCLLCRDKKSTPKKLVRKREELFKIFAATMNRLNKIANTPRTPQIFRAQELLAQLEKTFPSREGALRLELWDAYFGLGQALTAQNDAKGAIEMTLKGLEALGYSVVACPPRKEDVQKPTLEIKKWGQANEFTIVAFLQISHAYEILAPQLCAVAKVYARIVHSICFGEKDTIESVFPEAV